MKKIHEDVILTEAQRERVLGWYRKHKDYVFGLVYDEKYTYPPSGSDKDQPALWKSAHWNWFLKLESYYSG